MISAIATDNTITFTAKDGTTSQISVDNVGSATKATKDGSGNVIVDTYYKKSDATNMNTSLQTSINSKQDKLTFDTTPPYPN